MNVAAAVLTRNIFDHDRVHDLEQTLDSLRVGIPVYVVDNNSTDGTADYVRGMGGYCATDGVTTSGHGTNLCARVATGSGASIVVLSDDDIRWTPGWLEGLVAWWEAAPETVLLTGCHIEPDYPWNTVYGTVHLADRKALLRESTGAATWSFRAADWPKIGPIPEKVQGWGDVPACRRIRAQGYDIAQIDLAVHAGAGRSTWGNRSSDFAPLTP